MLSALAIVLGIAESFMSPLIPIAGVKLGVSNIVVMFAFFFCGFWSAMGIAAVKSLFALVGRGAVAFVLSACGGIAALVVIALLTYLAKDAISLLMKSVAGGIAHNFVQLIVIRLLYNMDLLAYYAPILLISGIISGTATAYIYKAAESRLRRLL